MTKYAAVLTIFLVATLATAPSALAQTGFFALGGEIGFVKHLGTVLRGERIDITVVMEDEFEGDTCPLKATIWLMQRNNFNGAQRRIVRINNPVATVTLAQAQFTGEGVLVLQTQNENDDCIGYIDIAIDTPFGANRAPESRRRR